MSPYKSRAQLGLMHAKHPEVAAKWDKKYGVPKGLPDHVRPKREGKSKKDK